MANRIRKPRRRYSAGGQRQAQPTESVTQTDESSVYARGQTVIPKTIREAVAIEYGTRLHWEVREGVIHVIPIPQHPVRALRGILKGSGMTYAGFMQERQRERRLEREQEREWERKNLSRLSGTARTPGSS